MRTVGLTTFTLGAIVAAHGQKTDLADLRTRLIEREQEDAARAARDAAFEAALRQRAEQAKAEMPKPVSEEKRKILSLPLKVRVQNALNILIEGMIEYQKNEKARDAALAILKQ